MWRQYDGTRWDIWGIQCRFNTAGEASCGSSPVKLEHGDESTGLPDVAANRGGRWVAVWDQGDRIGAFRGMPASWSGITEYQGTAASDPWAAVDPDGNILVAYKAAGNLVVLRYTFGSSTWSSAGVESRTEAVHMPRIAVDGLGNAIVVWPQGNNPPVFYANRFSRDDVAPTLTVPADMTVEATKPEGAVVAYSISATDAGDPTPSLLCTPSSGSTFPLGTTTVFCTAKDDEGNVASKSFKVTVRDTTAPTLIVPADITVEATSPAGATVTFAVDAGDPVDPEPVVACSPASGSIFALGVTTVTCTATDDAGNEALGDFLVSVRDSTPPELALPANPFVEATSPQGAVVVYEARASDAADPTPTLVCSPASGSTFPMGSTTVTCTATDNFGNEATASFTVTVSDTTDPSLNVPADMTVEATGPTGAIVTFTVTATDVGDASPSLTCSPSSGSTFPLGTTTVSCTARDDTGNEVARTFNVRVRDTTPPVIAIPADLVLEATGAPGAVASFEVDATDTVDLSPDTACLPAPGSVFSLGTTTVTCTATDNAGNEATGTFTVTVRDTTSPVLTVPEDLTVVATSPEGAVVAYESDATDVVGGSLPMSCSPASGSTFPVGTTTVTCSATDASGNTASRAFTVTVEPAPFPLTFLAVGIVGAIALAGVAALMVARRRKRGPPRT